MKTLYKTATAAVLATSAALLAACGGATDSPAEAKTVTLNGVVHGGQAPLTGSLVYLYQAAIGNTTQAVANTTTDSTGAFSLKFNCSGAAGAQGSSGVAASDGQMYIVTYAGNPGGAPGTNNTAAVMTAALGTCSSLPAKVVVNEVTTAAAAYALSGYWYVDGVYPNIAASFGVPASDSTNRAAFLTAMKTATVLADNNTGLIPASADANSYVADSQQKLYSLANALAACINTTSSSSNQCAMLFACATPGASYDSSANSCSGGTGTVPSNTLGAALNVVRNAGTVAAAGIYNVPSQNAVFSPGLASAPKDWTLALHFKGNGMQDVRGIAIDLGGKIWVGNSGGDNAVVSRFAADGTAIDQIYRYPQNKGNVQEIALDLAGNAYYLSPGYGYVYKLSADGTLQAGWVPSYLNQSLGLAIRPDGTVFVTVQRNDTSSGASRQPSYVVRLDNNLQSQGNNAYSAAYWPRGIAFDGGQDQKLWVASSKGTPAQNTDTGAYIRDQDGNIVFYGACVEASAIGSDGQSQTDQIYNTQRYPNASPVSPQELAIDGLGNVWATTDYPSLIKIDSNGNYLNGNGTGGGGLNKPAKMAIDGNNTVWITNYDGNSVSQFSNDIKPLSPTGDGGGFQYGKLSQPYGIAIDPAGNVWVSNAGSSSITKLIGAAAPTRVPLVAQVSTAQNGKLNLKPF